MEYLIGLMLSLVVAGSATIAGFDRDRAFYPTVLIVIASYYVLFAVMGASGRTLLMEIVAASGFLLFAVLGFRRNLWLVVAAIVGHGIFDFVHHLLIENPGVPRWWPQSHAGISPFDPKFAQTLGGSATSNPPTEFLKADQNKEQSTMKRSSLALVAVTLLAAVGMSLHGLAQTQNQAPSPARSRSDEMLDRWNDIGNKLVAMAKDFPEDKYDFKVQKDQRTFVQNLLHAAALDFVLIRRVSGSNVGPDFGEGDNPSRDVFKTKADVVKFVQEAVADGAQVIQQQGDAGLDNTSRFFGNRLAHNSSIWTFAIEHSGEHYGQLVVYYRANNLVPPDSRR